MCGRACVALNQSPGRCCAVGGATQLCVADLGVLGRESRQPRRLGGAKGAMPGRLLHLSGPPAYLRAVHGQHVLNPFRRCMPRWAAPAGFAGLLSGSAPIGLLVRVCSALGGVPSDPAYTRCVHIIHLCAACGVRLGELERGVNTPNTHRGFFGCLYHSIVQ